MSRWPVYQPSYFREPPCRVTPWDELESNLHGMNRRMREMDQHLNTVFNQFLQLSPRDGMPSVRRGESLIEDAITTDQAGNRNFQLQYDVSHFRPEDIKLKTKNGRLEVTAQCEMGDDNHRMYREYRRTCTLPRELNTEQLRSTYSPDGILTIEAPLPAIEALSPQAQAQARLEQPRPLAIEHHKGDAK